MDKPLSIWQTYDGGFIVTGQTQSFESKLVDYWILKLSSNGEIEWQKTYGGDDSEWPSSIQQTRDGGYIVAGSTESYGAGGTDYWILKLSQYGEIEWQKTYGGGNADRANSIQQTIDGGYIVAGNSSSFEAGGIWILKLYQEGEIEWQKTYEGGIAWSIQQTIDGGFIIAGETESYGAGESDYWVLKISPEGDVEWQKTYGGDKSDRASSIQQTADGGYIFAGSTWSHGAINGDIWILKLFLDGEIEWQKKYSYNEYDLEEANSIQQTVDGGYIVAGSYSSSGTIGNDFWVIKLYSEGEIEWQKTYGAGFQDYARSIQQTYDGGYIVAGETMSFGEGNYDDFWIYKLSSNGEIGSSCGLIESTNASSSDTNISPEDTSIVAQDTNVIHQNTNTFSQNTEAIEYHFCAGKCTLRIKTSSAINTTEPPPGHYIYDPGTKVTIKAIPYEGYSFFQWSGDVSGNSNPVTITMDSDKSIEAAFFKPGAFFGDLDIGCFIATATYDTPMAEEVKVLSAFRDRYLITNPMGQAFVRLYYNYSPSVAAYIRERESLKEIVRECLEPIVWIVTLVTEMK